MSKPDQIAFLEVELGGWNLLIRLSDVHEVMRVPKLTPIPMAPVHILGASNVHGRIVIVLDPFKVLALTKDLSIQKSSRLLVFQHAKMNLGILVDAVYSSRELEVSGLELDGDMNKHGVLAHTMVEGVTMDVLSPEIFFREYKLAADGEEMNHG